MHETSVHISKACKKCCLRKHTTQLCRHRTYFCIYCRVLGHNRNRCIFFLSNRYRIKNLNLYNNSHQAQRIYQQNYRPRNYNASKFYSKPNYVCFRCGKFGHIRRYCKVNKQRNTDYFQKQTNYNTNENYLQNDNSKIKTIRNKEICGKVMEKTYALGVLEMCKNKLDCEVKVKIEGYDNIYSGLNDTGASKSIISNDILTNKHIVRKCNVEVITVNKGTISNLGVTNITLNIKGKRINHDFIVCNNLTNDMYILGKIF